MAFLPWRARRKFFYFSIFALAALAIIAGFVWYFWPQPNCSDGKQNGTEEGVDCGGSCAPCLGEVKDISTLWVRAFKVQENYYDVAALVENPNLNAGLPSVKYQFKLYDANNIVLAVREGQTFINPGEKQVIVEGGIFAGSRSPKYAYIEFESVKNWEYIKKEKSFLSVVKKDFINFPSPRLSVEIKNESVADIENVSVAAILYDASGNAQGVSLTKIDAISSESTRPAFFTWPQPFSEEPSSIEVTPTTDLMNNN